MNLSFNQYYFEIESALKQRDLFKRYCDGEDIFSESISHERTTAKRSVDELPGEEGRNKTIEFI